MSPWSQPDYEGQIEELKARLAARDELIEEMMRILTAGSVDGSEIEAVQQRIKELDYALFIWPKSQ